MIGIVAWPAQLTRLTFISSRYSSRVHRGHDVRPDGRRREIDRSDAGLQVARSAGSVHLRRRRLKHKVRKFGAAKQPVDALVRYLEAFGASPSEPFAVGVDPDHVPRLDERGALELVHHIGSDVSG